MDGVNEMERAREKHERRRLDAKHRDEDRENDIQAARARVKRLRQEAALAQENLDRAVEELLRLEDDGGPEAEEPDRAIRRHSLADTQKKGYDDLPF